MAGLILQDLLGMKRILKSYGAILVFYVVLGLTSGQASDFGAFFIFFSAFMVAPIFAYREKCHWDMYANTMPVNRKDMVGATYVTSIVMLSLGVLLNLIFIGIDALKAPEDPGWLGESLLVAEIVAMIGFFFIGLMLPILFKFGSERGRIMLFVVYLIPVAIIVLGSKMEIDWTGLFAKIDVDKLMTGLKVGLPIATVIWLAATYAISLKIYRNKDLA